MKIKKEEKTNSLKRLSDIFRRRRKHTPLKSGHKYNVISAFTDNHETIGKTSAHTVDNMKKWQKVYSSDGLIFSIINTISQSMIGNGYEIRSENKDAEKIIIKFINSIDFTSILSDIVRFVLIFGDVYVEKIYSKFNLHVVNLTLVDPTYMNIHTDKFGIEQYYTQTDFDNLNKEIIIQTEDMIHMKLFSVPNSPFGLSVIGANYDTIMNKINVDESVAAAIIRHGSPKYHVSVGSQQEGEFPSEDILLEIESKFRNMNSANEFVTPSVVDINTIDVHGVENISEYYEYFISLITSGFNIPIEAVGITTSGSTEASGKVRERLYNRFLESLQRRISTMFERNIFPDLIKEQFPNAKVFLTFGENVPEKLVNIRRWSWPFVKVVGTDQEILSKNEIRSLFGFPPTQKSGVKSDD